MKLSSVLLWKIGVTIVLWATPLLLSPPPLFAALGMPTPEPPIVARLLGAAYVALLVVYLNGWMDVRAGRYPRLAVLAGIVSNGLGCALMVVHGASGSWSGWGALGQIYMWISAVAAGAIAVGLLFGRMPKSPS